MYSDFNPFNGRNLISCSLEFSWFKRYNNKIAVSLLFLSDAGTMRGCIVYCSRCLHWTKVYVMPYWKMKSNDLDPSNTDNPLLPQLLPILRYWYHFRFHSYPRRRIFASLCAVVWCKWNLTTVLEKYQRNLYKHRNSICTVPEIKTSQK